MRLHATPIIALAAASSVCLSAGLAHAQDDEGNPEFQRLVDAGKERYADGDLAGALELFEEAYAVDPRPKLLFNMGLVSERLGDLDKAVKYYEEFVGAAGNIPLELRARGQERLEVLRPIVEDRRKQAAKNDGKTDPLDPKGPGEPKDPKGPKGPGDPPGEGGGPGVAALATLVLGGAAALGGGALLLTLPDEMAFVQEPTAAARRSARSSRGLQETLGYSLLGAGGALVITGAALWIMGGETEGASASAPTLAPHVGPREVGATLRFSF